MPATDTFSTHLTGLSSPLVGAQSIIPDDGTDLPTATRAIYCGGSGDLRVRLLDGSDVVLRGAPGGSFLPMRVAQVFASGTTATDLVGLY